MAAETFWLQCSAHNGRAEAERQPPEGLPTSSELPCGKGRYHTPALSSALSAAKGKEREEERRDQRSKRVHVEELYGGT